MSIAEDRGRTEENIQAANRDAAQIHLGNEIGLELLTKLGKAHGSALIDAVLDQRREMDEKGELYKDGKLVGLLDLMKLGLKAEELGEIRQYVDGKVKEQEQVLKDAGVHAIVHNRHRDDVTRRNYPAQNLL